MAFTQQLTQNFAMDPSTGQIMDISSGRMYGSYAELGQEGQAQQMLEMLGAEQPKSQAPAVPGVAGIGSGAGSLGLGSMISSAFGGSAAAAPAASVPIGSAIGGGTITTGATLPMTTGAATTGTAAAGSGLAAAALPAAGIAAGLGTGILQGKGVYDAVRGKDLSLASQAALALPTFGTSFLYNPVKKFFGSKREGERTARKQGRKSLQDAGLMGEDSRSIYSLADGSGYDIRTAPDKRAYEIKLDSSGKPIGDQDAIGFLDAATRAMYGGKDNRLRTQMTGELYNSYNSNGKLSDNLKFMGDKLGGRDAIYAALAAAASDPKNKISENERDSGFAAIDKFYGIGQPKAQAKAPTPAPAALIKPANGTKPIWKPKK